ncbi:hypothetical protein M5K25_012803 [Dendrobium thyrsiflorum]|uniref:Uncharacterized protein n=1 Tax=Dendrobium thyrsiflorum TaxID=117978 RepID=A0ABD0UYR6_DENTH
MASPANFGCQIAIHLRMQSEDSIELKSSIHNHKVLLLSMKLKDKENSQLSSMLRICKISLLFMVVGNVCCWKANKHRDVHMDENDVEGSKGSFKIIGDYFGIS